MLSLIALPLLTGTGESGKSTIAKQLKMIYQNGFNEDERRSYKDVIHSNAIIGMRSLVLAADRLGLEYASPEAKARASVTSLIVNSLTTKYHRSAHPSSPPQTCLLDKSSLPKSPRTSSSFGMILPLRPLLVAPTNSNSVTLANSMTFFFLKKKKKIIKKDAN